MAVTALGGVPPAAPFVSTVCVFPEHVQSSSLGARVLGCVPECTHLEFQMPPEFRLWMCARGSPLLLIEESYSPALAHFACVSLIRSLNIWQRNGVNRPGLLHDPLRTRTIPSTD